MKHNILSLIPSIEELMSSDEVSRLTQIYDREIVAKIARKVTDSVRADLKAGNDVEDVEQTVSFKRLAERMALELEKKFSPSIRYAINATGVILHTGLGRARMSDKAVEAVNDVIRGYSTLAADIETGQRCSRDIHYMDLLCELTGAEAATTANNNAAATMLILNTLAKGKEVIVSRGQLVEIGGSFRLPDVMESSGAVLREVGTTNKTHLKDYVKAINENTGAILRVHMSNYRIVGFFEEPPIEDLVKVAQDHNVPIIDDIGSGALVNLGQFGMEPEPMVRDSIRAGVDVACFSGDKLIGGPQCGIIVGKSKVIKEIKENPLSRALRIGKMEVAALEATLRLFLEPGKLNDQHPTYRMLSRSLEELEARAQNLAEQLKEISGFPASVEVADGSSQVGSGSVPAEMMPTKLLTVKPRSMTAENLAKRLRRNAPPIYPRIHQQTVIFDLRTIWPDEDAVVVKALQDILA